MIFIKKKKKKKKEEFLPALLSTYMYKHETLMEFLGET